MALHNISAERFREVLAANLTPSATIKTPERLFGRQRALTQIERSLASQGRQVFIYGDRGVGKTSLALSANGDWPVNLVEFSLFRVSRGTYSNTDRAQIAREYGQFG